MEEPLTPDEFAERMAEIYPQPEAKENQPRKYDAEIAHEEADKLMIEMLCSLGYGEGCDMFWNATKWYS
jgi:hypothetical protein